MSLALKTNDLFPGRASLPQSHKYIEKLGKSHKTKKEVNGGWDAESVLFILDGWKRYSFLGNGGQLELRHWIRDH